MTLEELEVLVKQIQKQVQLNTLAIQQVNNNLNKYVTLDSIYSMKVSISDNSSNITTLQQQVAKLTSSIGLVNKMSKLLDTNFTDVTKDDIIQFDGDRWTNIKPSTLGIQGGSGVTTLEALADVRITNKADKQALCWDNSTSKWINYTISGSGGSGDFDVTKMWQELAMNSSNIIHPSHIKGNLSITSLNTVTLTSTGTVNMTNGNTALNVLNSGVTVNGNLLGTGEISAYTV